MSPTTENRRRIEVTYKGQTGVVVDNDHIGTTHPEWPIAWESLADLTGGDYCETNLTSLECWQYMGSVKVAFPVLQNASTYGCEYRWLHEFRHRDRPAPQNETALKFTGRVTLRIAASGDFRG